MSVEQVDALPGRKFSGIEASISPWTAFLFGIHCISLSSSGILVFAGVVRKVVARARSRPDGGRSHSDLLPP